MDQLRSILETGATLALVLLVAALTACGDETNGEDRNGPGAAPTETPDDSNGSPADFFYELVATAKTVPSGEIQVNLSLAESDPEYQELWGKYRFEDDAPEVDWENEAVIFVATGESGTCPLNLMNVAYDPDDALITVEVSEDVDEDTACTDDWTPRAFVIAVSADPLDEDELFVSLYHAGYGPGEMDREQVRGSEAGETPTPTPAPDQNDFAGWYDLLATDKAYPHGEFDDPLFELAEDKDRYGELWAWFEIEEDPPAVDFDTRAVLFSGTGESGSCPLFLNLVEFHDEERIITIDATTEDPDAMCTMDWTPRVFVVAMDREHLGEGELLALFYSSERDDELDPDDGVVIREG